MLKGNARLIHLHRLDWDEIRAIVQRGRELLIEGGCDVHIQAQWRNAIEKCKRHRSPLSRHWLGHPLVFAREWTVGATRIVPSRGYLPENLARREDTPSAVAATKQRYSAEFRHDRSSIFVAVGLEEVPLQAADGSHLRPVEREGQKPWTGFPGGKAAYLVSLLQRASHKLENCDDELADKIRLLLEHL